jgi:hypothetical protein
MIFRILIAGFCAVLVSCGSFYPDSKPDPNWDGASLVDCRGSPDILSYHFHITYMFKQDQIDAVQELRNKTQEYFAPFLGENPICEGTPHDKSGRFGKAVSSGSLFSIFINIF